MNLADRCQKISLILSDVDGVLTDGRLHYHSDGTESKSFYIRDGMGIRIWREAGYRFGLITARTSAMVERRARELKIDILHQGKEDKLTQVDSVAKELGVSREEIAYIGDDLLDLPAIQAVGLGITVADAAPDVLALAHHVTTRGGGQGAVREAIEMILQKKGIWEETVAPWTGSPAPSLTP